MAITLDGTTGITSPAIDVTTPITVADGGTGLSSVGTSGNVLTSNGTAWVSSALPASGVTSLNGQTGAITNTDLYAIGSYVTGRAKNYTNYTVDTTLAGSSLWQCGTMTEWNGTNFIYAWNNSTTSASLVNTGTWRCVSNAYSVANRGMPGLWVRIS